jgi:tetratricopeptide (TPR) repeat protein
MGRYAEALQVEHYLVFELGAPATTVVNLVFTAQTLGRHALADSGLAILREQLPPGHLWILRAAAGNAYSAGDLLLVDSLAREMATDEKAGLLSERWEWLAGLASMRGRVNEALALADSAAALAFEANALYWAFNYLRFIELTSLAADAPERATPYLESFRSQLTHGTGLGAEYWSLGVIAYGYALAGDLELARDLLAVMDSLAANDDPRPGRFGKRVLALVALQEGRAEDALEHLHRAQPTDSRVFWENRLLLADAHAALGHLNEAIAQYDTLTGTYLLNFRDRHASFPLRPLAHERLGSLYLQVGDTVAAARHLAEFIDLWGDADPELQARRLLAQLAAEGT